MKVLGMRLAMGFVLVMLALESWGCSAARECMLITAGHVDVPVIPGAKRTNVTANPFVVEISWIQPRKPCVKVEMMVPGTDLDAVRAWYQERLIKEGWKLDPSSQGGADWKETIPSGDTYASFSAQRERKFLGTPLREELLLTIEGNQWVENKSQIKVDVELLPDYLWGGSAGKVLNDFAMLGLSPWTLGLPLYLSVPLVFIL